MSEKTGQKSDISGYFYTDSYDYILSLIHI